MKKIILRVMLGIASIFMYSCADNTEQNTHSHSDGSTHTHPDTMKLVQEQFKVTDTPATAPAEKEHTHKDGEPHSH